MADVVLWTILDHPKIAGALAFLIWLLLAPRIHRAYMADMQQNRGGN